MSFCECSTEERKSKQECEKIMTEYLLCVCVCEPSLLPLCRNECNGIISPAYRTCCELTSFAYGKSPVFIPVPVVQLTYCSSVRSGLGLPFQHLTKPIPFLITQMIISALQHISAHNDFRMKMLSLTPIFPPIKQLARTCLFPLFNRQSPFTGNCKWFLLNEDVCVQTVYMLMSKAQECLLPEGRK